LSQPSNGAGGAASPWSRAWLSWRQLEGACWDTRSMSEGCQYGPVLGYRSPCPPDRRSCVFSFAVELDERTGDRYGTITEPSEVRGRHSAGRLPCMPRCATTVVPRSSNADVASGVRSSGGQRVEVQEGAVSGRGRRMYAGPFHACGGLDDRATGNDRESPRKRQTLSPRHSGVRDRAPCQPNSDARN
jgi:hypothetical protein